MLLRADSSVGRAPRLQRGGLGFESPSVHHEERYSKTFHLRQ